MKPSARNPSTAQKFTADHARDTAFFKERDRIRAENEEKTKRLRTQRLAKEAADREAAEKAAAERPPLPTVKKKRPSSP